MKLKYLALFFINSNLASKMKHADVSSNFCIKFRFVEKVLSDIYSVVCFNTVFFASYHSLLHCGFGFKYAHIKQ